MCASVVYAPRAALPSSSCNHWHTHALAAPFVAQEEKKKELEQQKRKLEEMRAATEERAKAAAERAKRLEANDGKKLAALEGCVTTLAKLQETLVEKVLPEDVSSFPPLDSWLETKGLQEFSEGLQEWELPTLLDTAHATPDPKAWDGDFSDVVPSLPKRRKLWKELRAEWDKRAVAASE